MPYADYDRQKAQAREWAQAHVVENRAKASKWRVENPDAYAHNQRRRKLEKNFGLTLDQYEQMLEMQGGVCAICRNPPKKIRLAVDHDHKDGRVRCLVCFHCNRYKLGTNTALTAIKVAEICNSTFDGRLLSRSSLQKAPETA